MPVSIQKYGVTVVMFNVLIVDDEDLICELIQETVDWEKINAKCIGVATDGNSAYKKFEELKPDLIIADIRMPGMDGISLLKKVRATGSKCGFIIISGYQDFDYVKSAIEFGADNYVLKPINQEELESTILKSINKYSTIESNEKKVNDLELEVSEVRKKNREIFLRKALIDHDVLPFDSIEECNREFGSHYCDGRFCVGIINIDYLDEIDHCIKKSYSDSVETSFIRYIGDLQGNTIFEADTLKAGNTIAFVLNYPPASEEEVFGSLAGIITKIRDQQRPLAFYITISLGEPVDTINDIYLSYVQAAEASSYRIKVGVDRVIRYGNYNFLQYNVYKLLSIEWEQQFNCNIDIGNIDAVLEGIKKLFSVLYTLDSVNPKAYYDLSAAILESFKNKIRFLYPGIADEAALTNLSVEDNIIAHKKERIVDNLLRIIRDTLTVCIEKKTLHDKKPINFAKQYVASHYMEKILISDITEKIFMNDDYFSILFKKETGINFSDYVINYRMTVARQLLRTGDNTICEVGEKVGYDDSKYFSRIFKKNIGVTPGEYRKLYD